MKTVRTAASKMGTASSRVSFNPQRNNYQLFLEKKNEYGEWVLRIKDGKYQDYFFDTNRLPLGGNSIYQEIMESGSNSIRSVVESVNYGIYPSNLFQLLYILEHVEKFDPSRFIVEYTLKVPLIGALVQGMVSAIQFLFNDGGILKLAKLSEIEKASYFKSSSRCTTAILMFDFLNGQGPHVRFFDESHAIVKDLKWGTLSDLAFEKWLKLDKTGSVVEGVPLKISVKTSFDNSDFDTGFEVINKSPYLVKHLFGAGLQTTPLQK